MAVPQKILFVCTGNICRSPTAEGVLRHYLNEKGLAEKVIVDSAGTHAYHIDEPPDIRSIRTARKRGINIEDLVARQVTKADFDEFDLIFALDYEHLRLLRKMAPTGSRATTHLFLEYVGGTREKEVPDPYYGDSYHFEYVLDLTETGVKALMRKLKLE